jgi:hypothetical protein
VASTGFELKWMPWTNAPDGVSAVVTPHHAVQFGPGEPLASQHSIQTLLCIWRN